MSLHKLKVDKFKLIELCGTSESEFTSVSLFPLQTVFLYVLNCYIVCFISFPLSIAICFQLLLQVSTTMKDLCFDVFGTAKEKKDPRAVKGNRGKCSQRFRGV